jgi:hypothetical protein
MLVTTARVFGIQTVSAIQPSNGTLVVAFRSGLVARFPPDHPDRDKMVREAEDSLQQRRPVAIIVNGEGWILELTHAHETGVASLREDEEDTNRLAVWFWEYSPVCYLTREHPEFDGIQTTLEQAAATGSRVWLANRMHLVEGETEIWWQILDVRPVESLLPGA